MGTITKQLISEKGITSIINYYWGIYNSIWTRGDINPKQRIRWRCDRSEYRWFTINWITTRTSNCILNIPFVFLGYKQIGKSFAIYSVIGIASLAFGRALCTIYQPLFKGIHY